ncbi:MAG: hypothetical protein JNL32_10045, partial [Candidatus Kapabacteria bacterium]|nr:hypothetical protein [Candidatus Kapabacteria bacterium]
MIRHSILLLIAVLLCSTLMSAYAQDGVPPAAQSLIDSALTILDMTKRDCAMRHDAVTVDPFRLQLMKDVFAQPFKLCSTTVAHTSFLKKYAGDEFDLYAARIMRDMQFGTYKPMLLDDDAAYTKTAITIRTPFGATVQRADFENNLTYQAIIRRYFVPLFQAAKLIGQTRDAFLRDSIIIRNCDSLLMMSEDDGNASVYALKAAEREADATSRMYFDNAALHSVSTVSSVSLSLYTQIMSHIPVTRAAYSVFYDSLRSVVIETPYGRIAIGGKGDDIYEGEYFLIFDIGGNDKYFLYSSKNSALSYPVRAIVDFGGNDMYVGNGYSIAAGIAGCGLLIDVAGNDTYDGGSFSLGSGLWGVGILHDMSGTDRYNGGVFSQAAGAFGIGMLIDAKGNDSYSVQANGQAFASVKGFGLLCDQSGNDIYTTQSPFVDVLRYDSHFVSFTQGAALGHRPIASGGIALLYDVSGNDNYISDIYGQATSYWFGIGALVDDDGEDRYSSYQYAQGAGIHFAHALLWDAKGDDTYVSHGVSQGCGHDVGFGFLLDESGDDSYIAESLSLGGGNANAVSILCDVRGNDSYIARNLTNCFGFSDFRRTYGMIGIFADGGGNDMYGNTARNSTVELKSYYGVFLDNPAPATETQKATSGTTPPALV